MAFLERLRRNQGFDIIRDISSLPLLTRALQMTLWFFYRANMDSFKIVRTTLNDFAWLSGLVINLEKSHVILSEANEEFETSL